jgi:predicted nucleic acid-binding protein
MSRRKSPTVSSGLPVESNGMQVETDFLLALAKGDDWLTENAEAALEEHDDIHATILSYAEFLMVLYNQDTTKYNVDLPRAVVNLVEKVPVYPVEQEEAVLLAAALAEEHNLTPFDALHAATAVTAGEQLLTSEQDYDDAGVDRIPLENSE